MRFFAAQRSIKILLDKKIQEYMFLYCVYANMKILLDQKFRSTFVFIAVCQFFEKLEFHFKSMIS